MKRPYYPTKAAWARARAAELRKDAHLLPLESIHNWRAVKRRTAAGAALRAEANRFDAMAERFAARGV